MLAVNPVYFLFSDMSIHLHDYCTINCYNDRTLRKIVVMHGASEQPLILRLIVCLQG